MKNSSKKTTNANENKTTKVKNVQVVFGKEIVPSWRSEIKVLLKAIQSFEGKTEKVTFADVYSVAKEIRTSKEFDLKPFDELSKGSKTNFINRLAKTLGGSIISASQSNSIQGRFFNFEVQTGKRVKFDTPINPLLPLSKQVKDNLIDFSSFKVADLKKTKRKFETLNKSQLKELENLKS